MKKITCIMIFLMAVVVCIGPTSAYLINCDCPTQVTVGETLEITGTSNLPPGFNTHIAMYKGTKEIAKKIIIIQADGSWRVTFDTEGLTSGQYKIEILEKSVWVDDEYIVYEYGSSSDTVMSVEILDRSGEVTVTSPLIQGFRDVLEIQGEAHYKPNMGIEMTVDGPSGVIFGPEYISTGDAGQFSKDVSISETGTYEVTFSDDHGFIKTVIFSVRGATTPPPLTPTEGSEDTVPPGIEATALASRDNPAYFEVDTQTGILVLTTSTGIDWVVEYIDEDGQLAKINDQGIMSPETAQLSTRGGQVFVKVYPVKYTVEETVHLYAQNANSIRVSSQAALSFGDEVPVTPTQQSPLPIICALGALGIAILSRTRQ